MNFVLKKDVSEVSRMDYYERGRGYSVVAGLCFCIIGVLSLFPSIKSSGYFSGLESAIYTLAGVVLLSGRLHRLLIPLFGLNAVLALRQFFVQNAGDYGFETFDGTYFIACFLLFLTLLLALLDLMSDYEYIRIIPGFLAVIFFIVRMVGESLKYGYFEGSGIGFLFASVAEIVGALFLTLALKKIYILN